MAIRHSLEKSSRQSNHVQSRGDKSMGRTKGITPRGNSIRIDFYLDGQRCRETLKLPPTKPNLIHAERLKASIRHAIAIGKFRYGDFFPDSKRARIGLRSSLQTVSEALD